MLQMALTSNRQADDFISFRLGPYTLYNFVSPSYIIVTGLFCSSGNTLDLINVVTLR